jgi:hypothetical protein
MVLQIAVVITLPACDSGLVRSGFDFACDGLGDSLIED